MRLTPFLFASQFIMGCSNNLPKDVDKPSIEESCDHSSDSMETCEPKDTSEPVDTVEDTGEPSEGTEDTGEPVDTVEDSGEPDPPDTGDPPSEEDTAEESDDDLDGVSVEAGDCDDSNPAMHPGAIEICDGVDNNCDGSIDDDATDQSTFYRDRDGDGFGDAATSLTACEAPSGFIDDSTDCDDSNSLIHPAAVEVCDELNRDEDCDGAADDDDSSADWSSMTPFYPDADGDGFGDSFADAMFCDLQPGFTLDFGDCDDADGAIHPGAEEICDGFDNDCDGEGDVPGSMTLVYTPSSGSPITVHRDAEDMAEHSESDPFDSFEHFGSGEHIWTFCEGDFAVEGTLTEDSTIRSVSGDPTDVSLSGSLSGTVLKVFGDDIQLRIEGVTIEDGLADELAADGSLPFDLGSGGGVFCRSHVGTTQIIVEDSRFVSNQTPEDGGMGGAIYTDGCTLDLRHSVFEQNQAGFAGGGIYLQDADLLMDNVELRDNQGSYTSAVLVTGQERDVQVDVSSSLFEGNENGSFGYTFFLSGDVEHVIEAVVSDTSFVANHGGISAVYTAASTIHLANTDLLLENVGGLEPGVTENEQPGIRLHPNGAGSYLDVSGMDFGDGGDGRDNLPYDVAIGTSDITYERYNSGNDAHFICEARPGTDNSACSNDRRHPDGDPTNDQYDCHYGGVGSVYSQSSAMIANSVMADRNSTLKSFSFYLDVSPTCELDFYLMERADDDAWVVLRRRLNVEVESPSVGWQNSGDFVDHLLEEGVEYAMAVGWHCPTGDVRYWRGASGGTGPGFGDPSGHFEIDDHRSSTSYGIGHEVEVDYTGSSVFRANLSLTDLDSDSSTSCVD